MNANEESVIESTFRTAALRKQAQTIDEPDGRSADVYTCTTRDNVSTNQKQTTETTLAVAALASGAVQDSSDNVYLASGSKGIVAWDTTVKDNADVYL